MVLGAFGQLILDARKIFEVRKSRVILVLYAITIGGVHQLGDLVAGSVLLPGQLSLKALCICPKIVGSALQHWLERADPVLRTWCLVQNPDDENPDPRRRQRATIAPADAAEDPQAARAREALRLLMRCSIVEVAFHVCTFAF